MPDSPLYELYRLHVIDSALEEMKSRASALDAGKSILNAMQRLREEHGEALNLPVQMESEIKDLEGKNEIYSAKVKQIEKDLYGGKIVNPKEIAGFETEVKQLKTLCNSNDERMLELMDQLPEAQANAKPIRAKLAEMQKQADAKKAADIAESHQLQAAYKAKHAERAPQAALVPKATLTHYDAIRQKYGGIGMGVVTGKACGACGTQIAGKILDHLDNDRVHTCESCHRILIKLVPGS